MAFGRTDSAGDGTPALRQRKHLRRLGMVFERGRAPLFLVAVCARHGSPMLADPRIHEILVCCWCDALAVYGWAVGRYVVMPDHVHFFAAPSTDNAKDISDFVGGWKNWTQRQIRKSALPWFAWQHEFFDHLMRSNESYAEKWEYVRSNAVRAGLVAAQEDWPYQGEIGALSW